MVYVYQCIHVHSCAHTCILTHEGVHVHVHVHIHSCTRTLMYVLHMYTIAHVLSCTYTSLHDDVYSRVYINTDSHVPTSGNTMMFARGREGGCGSGISVH